MTFDDYLLHLFYLVHTEYEALNLGRLRQRGPDPALHDAEVLTMELAGSSSGSTRTRASTGSSAGTTGPSSPP